MSTTPVTRQRWLGLLFLFYALVCLGITYGLISWSQSREEFITSQEIKIQAREDARALRAGRELPADSSEPVWFIPDDIPLFKQKFYASLLPAIQRQNDHILKQRHQLQEMSTRLQGNRPLTLRQQATLETWALRYRAPDNLTGQELVEELLMRVDVVPASMALAQAAMESAWGRSRFAKEANNYFGQWCFTPGCGVVPNRRAAGATHEVARFKNLDAAVAAYLLNINSHAAYDTVRQIRADLRQAEQPLDSLRLTQGLSRYSEKGPAYIRELNGIIRFNQLKQFDHGPISIAGQEPTVKSG